jgi:subtilisin family serine protease
MTKLLSFSYLPSLALLFSVSSLNASTIAVVDSGTDFGHKDLAAKAWINPLEIASNDRDEDRNGYPDDVNGWNFAESNNKLIDYKYANSNTEDARRFFDIQLKSFLGTINQLERDWVKEKFKDEAFIKNLQIFGNWMHGTHVTGITAKNSPDAKIVGIKLIPTEAKLPGKELASMQASKGKTKEAIVKAALKALAEQQTKVFVEIGTYINGTKADVMNGSFGTSYNAISGVITMLYKTVFRKEPTADELKIYTSYFFEINLLETKKFLSSAPNTLFVFAAGNEGSDNDVIPTSPTNVEAENKISVAATLGDQALANFSCYGANNVEVAAPGVGIYSTLPMSNYLAVSGTSQAAPYVANIAGMVKDANPKLGFREIKKIIMETVDVKSWLVGKVKTSGLVNRDRAVRAALLSRTLDLTTAISQSKNDILAPSANDKARGPRYFQVPKEFVGSLPSTLIFN